MSESTGRNTPEPPPETATGNLAREEPAKRQGYAGLTRIVDPVPDVISGLRLVPLADQIMPGAIEGLTIELPPLDFGISSLLAEQRSERLNALLARARSLMTGGQWRAALGVVQDARAAEPEAAEPMLLQVQCLFELRHFEAALRVANHARDRIADPEVRSLLLRHEAACVMATTRALEARLVELVDAGKVDEGLALVREGLGRQPSNIVFLCHLAGLLRRKSDTAGARRAIQEAQRHVGREGLDLIAEIERVLDFGSHHSSIESARQALRAGDATAALERLDRCAEDLGGNAHFVGLWEYAREARPSGFVLRRNPRTADYSGAARQQTLRWLLSEEIAEGDQAMRQRQYGRAIEAFRRAESIHENCGAVWYKHAQAVYLEHKDGSRHSGPAAGWEELSAAEALLTRATIDAAYKEPADALRAAIEQLQRERR